MPHISQEALRDLEDRAVKVEMRYLKLDRQAAKGLLTDQEKVEFQALLKKFHGPPPNGKNEYDV